MLKKIRLTSGWRASLKTPSLKLPDSVRPHVNDRRWIFLYSVNSRICGQFEPFRDFFLEPCSSHRPNVSFWNWNSVTQGIYGQVHPDEILVAHFLATTEIPSSLALCYYSVPQLHEHLNENNYTWGAFFWENPNAGFRIQKRILRVFLGKSKNGSWIHKNSGWILRIKYISGFLKFTIWAFFWERIWKKYFWQAVFQKEKLYASEAVHIWHSN